MSVSGHIGFGEEVEGVGQADQLGSLVRQPKVHLSGPFDVDLPDLVGECLVVVGCGCQLVSDSDFGDVFACLNPLVEVPGPSCQGVVGPFDGWDSSIGTVDRIPAPLLELLEVIFRLLLLVYQRSDPAGRVGDFHGLVRRVRSVGDFQHVLRRLEPEHVEIGGGRHGVWVNRR